MRSLAAAQRREIAMNLARAISFASWLGKHALNARSRARAYAVKSQRISTALKHFGEFFELILAERNPRHDILILVSLPTGYCAHVPFASLTAEVQARLLERVMLMIACSSARPTNPGHSFKRAA